MALPSGTVQAKTEPENWLSPRKPRVGVLPGLIYLSLLSVMAAAGSPFLTQLLPTNALKQEISREVERSLHRSFQIKEVVLRPTWTSGLLVDLKNIRLDAADHTPLLTAKSLQLYLSYETLLESTRRISKVIVIEPQTTVLQDGDWYHLPLPKPTPNPPVSLSDTLLRVISPNVVYELPSHEQILLESAVSNRQAMPFWQIEHIASLKNPLSFLLGIKWRRFERDPFRYSLLRQSLAQAQQEPPAQQYPMMLQLQGQVEPVGTKGRNTTPLAVPLHVTLPETDAQSLNYWGHQLLQNFPGKQKPLWAWELSRGSVLGQGKVLLQVLPNSVHSQNPSLKTSESKQLVQPFLKQLSLKQLQLQLNTLSLKASPQRMHQERETLQLNDLSGALLCARGVCSVKQLKTFWQKSPIEATASLALPEKLSLLDPLPNTLKTQGQLRFATVSLPALMRLFPEQATRPLPVNGTVKGRLTWAGTLAQPRLQGKLTLEQLNLNASNGKQKLLQARSLPVNLGVQASGQPTLQIPKTEVLLSGIPLTLSAQLKLQASKRRPPIPQGQIALKGSKLSLSALMGAVQALSRLGANAPQLPALSLTGQADLAMVLNGSGNGWNPEGRLTLHQAGMNWPARSLLARNMNGTLQFDPAQLAFQSMKMQLGMTPSSLAPVTLSGTARPDFNAYTLSLTTDHLSIATLQQLFLLAGADKWIAGNRSLQPLAKLILPAAQLGLTGTVSGDLLARKTLAQKDLVLTGQVRLSQVSVALPAFAKKPFRVKEAWIELKEKGRATIKRWFGSWQGVTYELSGVVTPAKPPQISLSTSPVSAAFLHREQATLNALLKAVNPSLQLREDALPASGTIQIATRAQENGGTLFWAAFEDVNLIQAPVQKLSGQVSWSTGGQLGVQHLTLNWNGEPVSISLDTREAGPRQYSNRNSQTRRKNREERLLKAGKSFKETPRQQFTLKTELPASWLDAAVLPPDARTRLTGVLPVRFEGVGRFSLEQLLANRPFLRGKMFVDLRQLQYRFPELSPEEAFAVLALKPASLMLSLAATPEKLVIRDGVLQFAETAQEAPSGQEVSDPAQVQFSGTMAHWLSGVGSGKDAQQTYDFKIATPKPIPVAALDSYIPRLPLKDATGDVSFDVTVHREKLEEMPGLAVSPKPLVEGNLRFNEVKVPYLKLRGETGRVQFQGEQAQLQLDQLRIPGVDLSATAEIPDIWTFPTQLDEVSITGKQFGIEPFRKFSDEILTQVVEKQLLDNIFRPRKPEEPVIPFEFRDAAVVLDEVFYHNVILSDFRSRLSVFPNSFVELADCRFQTAGGTVSGALSMNPLAENFLTVSLKPKQVKANALLVGLLKAPNVLFGEVDGDIHFTTRGMTDQEMMLNTNGTAAFTIDRGRIPPVAKLETILSAVNLLRGGLLGLNLNNLSRLLQPLTADYQARVTGDFKIGEGILYTNELFADGENLDLDITGGIRMTDGHAKVTVLGSMAQDPSGLFGTAGRFNLKRLLGFLPGIGDLSKVRGLLNYVPGVGFVPGFGGPPKNVNQFKVKIDGALDSPKSIRSIQWIDAPPKQKKQP